MATPATGGFSGESHEEQRRVAVQWVGEHKRRIKGRAAKFQHYSPYDLEDFIQQAYASALEAVDVCRKRELPFAACFWTLFTADCRMMGSNPVTADCYEEFAEDYTDQGYAPTFAQELIYEPDEECEIEKEDLEMIEGLIDIALSVMAPKQREVWHHLLGNQSRTISEIAKILKIRRQVVEELRDAGLRKVRKYFESVHD